MGNTLRYNADRDDSRAQTREAACAGRYDLFDYDSREPDEEETKETRAKEAKVRKEKVIAAKDICGQCAVREACLKDALANNENYGIRGGFTPSERKNLISPRCQTARRRQNLDDFYHILTRATGHVRQDSFQDVVLFKPSRALFEGWIVAGYPSRIVLAHPLFP